MKFNCQWSFHHPHTCTWTQRACETYKLDTRLEEGEQVGYRMAYSKENYRIKHYEFPQPDRDLCGKLRTVHSKEVYQAVLKSRSKLQSAQSEYVFLLCVCVGGYFRFITIMI